MGSIAIARRLIAVQRRRLKFAQNLDDISGAQRGESWDARVQEKRVARTEKNEFPHCHNMGNSVSEIGKMTIWGGEERSPVSRLNNSCCGRLIETEQTLVCREINRLANGMHVRCRHEACAKQVADISIKVPFFTFSAPRFDPQK